MKNKIPPPIILLLSGALMWLISRSDFALVVSVPYAMVFALLFAAAGLAVAAAAIQQFRQAQTTVNPLQPDAASALVESGIFGSSRNPMYLGLLLILAGWAVWLQSLGAAVVLVLFWLLLTELQIKPEEAALREIFGDRYSDYCRRVRRWI